MDIKYIIFDLDEINQIDFNEVLENGPETIRYSNTNKSFVKYVGETPLSIQSLVNKPPLPTVSLLSLSLTL